MIVTINLELTPEIQEEIKKETILKANEMLISDKTELRKIIKECVKGILKARINDLLQSRDYKDFLTEEIKKNIGMFKKTKKDYVYKELSLTRNIPVNPKYLYEFEIPSDADEILAVLDVPEGKCMEFDVYLNKAGERVVSTNSVPAVLKYYKKVEQDEI